MQPKEIKLLYGKNGINLHIKDNWNTDIIRKPAMPIIKDIKNEVSNILNNPINSESINEISSKDKSVCILVCDITRPVPNKLFLKQMILKFINAGILAENILIIIATGLHRPASKVEITKIIGSSWILKNIKIENHFARDDNMHRNIGTTKQGNIIKLDKRFPTWVSGQGAGADSELTANPGIKHEDSIIYGAKRNPGWRHGEFAEDDLFEDEFE